MIVYGFVGLERRLIGELEEGSERWGDVWGCAGFVFLVLDDLIQRVDYFLFLFF